MTTTIMKDQRYVEVQTLGSKYFHQSPKLTELITGCNFNFFQEITPSLSGMKDVTLLSPPTLLVNGSFTPSETKKREIFQEYKG